MRIIDNSWDFYDYLQDYNDVIVFDRRKSYLLTKELLCEKLGHIDRWDSDGTGLLLQCGFRYWAFYVEYTDTDDFYVHNYKLRLIGTWTDYDKPHVLMTLSNANFDEDDTVDTIRNAIDGKGGYFSEFDITSHRTHISTKNSWETKTYDIPILNACGINKLIDPLDIFCAIEEHLSLLKSEAERTDPLGITDKDKVIMHGFDTKTSFRGKNS